MLNRHLIYYLLYFTEVVMLVLSSRQSKHVCIQSSATRSVLHQELCVSIPTVLFSPVAGITILSSLLNPKHSFQRSFLLERGFVFFFFLMKDILIGLRIVAILGKDKALKCKKEKRGGMGREVALAVQCSVH